MKMSSRSRVIAITLGLSSLVVNAVAQTPMSPADRDAAARSAYARGDSARASSALNEAVRLNPFDPVALNNLAVNYAAQGDYQNAVSLLERAQRLAPNRSDIVNNLANLKAWMAQDSQFALGSRGTPQALNFPRAEDTPPELPPLWAPVGNQPPQQPAVRAATPVNAYPATPQQQLYQQQAPVYPQPGYPQQQPNYPQQPAYQQQPVYAPPSGQTAPTYSRVPTITERPDYSARSSTASAKQSMITERASEVIVRKKKKPTVLDCPAP